MSLETERSDYLPFTRATQSRIYKGVPIYAPVTSRVTINCSYLGTPLFIKANHFRLFINFWVEAQ